MHHMDANIMLGEKARWKLHKSVTCCFEQNLQAAIYKTTNVWLLTFHLKNYSSKMKKTYRVLLENQGWTHNQHFSINPYIGTCQYWMTRKDLHKLCANTRCSFEDLMEAMNDRDKWGERVNEMLAEQLDDDDDIYIYVYSYSISIEIAD